MATKANKIVSDPLIDLVRDAVRGDLEARRLFSGAGLYADGICFALLSRGSLYFKVSDETRDQYQTEGSKPFGYQIKGRRAALTSYYALPERLLDDPDELRQWALAAIEAATEARSKKAKKRPSATKRPAAKGAGTKPSAKKKAR